MLIPLLSVGLFALVFLLVETEKVDRNYATVSGAALMLLLGGLFGFYTPREALHAIYFDTLALIFGMSLIVHLLIRSGLFKILARRVAGYSRGNAQLVLVLLILISYGLSLVVGNLATMVILLPLTLALCGAVGLVPVPVVIAELIASNLGGASTLIGDFPNMVIGAAGHLHFDDFIGGMMVPCLWMLAMLLVYCSARMVRIEAIEPLESAESVKSVEFLYMETPTLDRSLARMGLGILGVTLLALVFAQPLGLQPSTIAFVAGVLVLTWGRVPQESLLKAMSGSDVLFFAALFIMVGGLQATGVLAGIHGVIVTLGGGGATPSLIVLMWIGALLTPFLNSGPTTVLLVPVASVLAQEFPGSPVWWALALGILAGSSATLTGATAGPVVASQMVHQREAHRRTHSPGWVLDSGRYRKVGIPITLFFLLFSTLYLAVVSVSS